MEIQTEIVIYTQYAYTENSQKKKNNNNNYYIKPAVSVHLLKQLNPYLTYSSTLHYIHSSLINHFNEFSVLIMGVNLPRSKKLYVSFRRDRDLIYIQMTDLILYKTGMGL